MREMSTMLTSTPILTTAPQIMREAEERGGADGDNLSAIIVRWGPETLADQPSTTTDTLELGEFETQLDSTLTLTDRTGIAARSDRRRDRARDRRDPVDDPEISEVGTARKLVGARVDTRRHRPSAIVASLMRQLLLDTETTGLDPKHGPPDHRDRRRRARQPPPDRAPSAFPARSRSATSISRPPKCTA